MTGSEHPCLDLGTVIGLSVIILFNNDQRNRLDLLVSGESLTAFITYTTAANGVVIFRRSRIDDSGIFMATERTFHRHPPYKNHVLFMLRL